MKISLWHEIFSLNTDLAMPFDKLSRIQTVTEMFIKHIAIFIEVYMRVGGEGEEEEEGELLMRFFRSNRI